jgi:membrane associated rhomboid family serine protease
MDSHRSSAFGRGASKTIREPTKARVIGSKISAPDHQSKEYGGNKAILKEKSVSVELPPYVENDENDKEGEEDIEIETNSIQELPPRKTSPAIPRPEIRASISVQKCDQQQQKVVDEVHQSENSRKIPFNRKQSIEVQNIGLSRKMSEVDQRKSIVHSSSQSSAHSSQHDMKRKNSLHVNQKNENHSLDDEKYDIEEAGSKLEEFDFHVDQKKQKSRHQAHKSIIDENNDYLAKSKSSADILRTLSKLHIAESQKKADPRLYRMGTVRDNVDDEVLVVYRPFFTYLMIIANAAFFLYAMYKSDWKFAPTNQNPLYGPETSVLVDLGAKDTSLIVSGEYKRLILPIFLHAGIIHLIMNLLMMKRLGESMEESFGFVMVAAIYITSGISGVMASCVMNPDQPGVGASGALYGLVGGMFGDFAQNHKTIIEGKWSYFFSMVISLALGIGLGMLPVMDNWAHIGGLVCGFLMGLFLLTNNKRDADGNRILPWYSKAASVISVVLLLIWILALAALLFSNKNGNQYCSWCKYLDCVPSPYWICPE